MVMLVDVVRILKDMVVEEAVVLVPWVMMEEIQMVLQQGGQTVVLEEHSLHSLHLSLHLPFPPQ
jgi:hypothetical protein